MSNNIEDILARLNELESREAIRELKSRYLRACDLKQVDDIRDTMLPDVVIDYEGFPPFADREAFLAIYQQFACQPGVYDIHHATNSVITFQGADEATGLWSLNFRSVILGMRQITQLGVEYEDRYVRRDGRWYIAASRSRRTSCLMQNIAEDGTATYVALGEAPGAFGESDQ